MMYYENDETRLRRVSVSVWGFFFIFHRRCIPWEWDSYSAHLFVSLIHVHQRCHRRGKRMRRSLEHRLVARICLLRLRFEDIVRVRSEESKALEVVHCNRRSGRLGSVLLEMEKIERQSCKEDSFIMQAPNSDRERPPHLRILEPYQNRRIGSRRKVSTIFIIPKQLIHLIL